MSKQEAKPQNSLIDLIDLRYQDIKKLAAKIKESKLLKQLFLEKYQAVLVKVDKETYLVEGKNIRKLSADGKQAMLQTDLAQDIQVKIAKYLYLLNFTIFQQIINFIKADESGYEKIKFFLENINECDRKSIVNTPVEITVEGEKQKVFPLDLFANNYEISKLLIESGANVKYVDEFGQSLLENLLLNGIDEEAKIKMARLYIENGATLLTPSQASQIERGSELWSVVTGYKIEKLPTKEKTLLQNLLESDINVEEKTNLAKHYIENGEKLLKPIEVSSKIKRSSELWSLVTGIRQNKQDDNLSQENKQVEQKPKKNLLMRALQPKKPETRIATNSEMKEGSVSKVAPEEEKEVHP